MCGILDLFCIPYSDACDVLVTFCDTFRQKRRSKK